MEDEAPPGLFCVWIEDGDNWRCRRCGALVRRSVSPERPFAGCKTGMRQAGVTPTDLVKAAPRYAIPQNGPGTELKKLLARIGIKAAPNCSCNQRAAQMNLWGCDVCEQRTEEIVGWLKEEATKRKLPFVEALGRRLVKWAISNARRSVDRPAKL